MPQTMAPHMAEAAAVATVRPTEGPLCRAARAAAGVSLFLSLAVFLAASYRLLTTGQGLYALLFSLYLLTVAAKSGGLAVSSKNGG